MSKASGGRHAPTRGFGNVLWHLELDEWDEIVDEVHDCLENNERPWFERVARHTVRFGDSARWRCIHCEATASRLSAYRTFDCRPGRAD